jgi:hypothetical protein
VTLRNYQPGHRPIKSRHFYQAGDNSHYPRLDKNVIIPGLIKMSAFDWSMTRWYKTHATGW